ncbi:MAG: YeeE/YedE thiosulfate transporter family protein [Pseudoxanthomonas sp.]
MSHFTPAGALIGGSLVGLAATLLLWFNGRIAGVSGILNSAVAERGVWRWPFLLGLVIGAGVFALLGGPVPVPRTGFPAWLLVVAGVLVGYGTALGNGCTSGHGVCGLARLSPRSLVAVVVFLGTAIATTYLLRHAFGVAT